MDYIVPEGTMRSYLLYIILWAGGGLISFSLLWSDSHSSKSHYTILFKDKTIALNVPKVSGNIVNELFLSANELNISGSTLICPGYKILAKDVQSLNTSGQKNTEKVYSTILLRKLQEVTSKSSSSGDFTIKPLAK